MTTLARAWDQNRSCSTLAPPHNIVLAAERDPIHVFFDRPQDSERVREEKVIAWAVRTEARRPDDLGGLMRSEEPNSFVEGARLDHTKSQGVVWVVLEENEGCLVRQHPAQFKKPRGLAGLIDV